MSTRNPVARGEVLIALCTLSLEKRIFAQGNTGNLLEIPAGHTNLTIQLPAGKAASNRLRREGWTRTMSGVINLGSCCARNYRAGTPVSRERVC
jgi:hypothetical protein